MIILDPSSMIGGGQVRRCFCHPHDDRLVIKVPAGPLKAQLQANFKEMKGYRFLLQRHGRLDCISHCHGWVETNHGKGLICDCIRDADGSISPTIWDVIHSDGGWDLDALLEIAGRVCRELVARDIWLFDLNLKNIALCRQADGTCRPIFLDLKGRYDNNEVIPLSSYIPFLARKKRDRRCRQLLQRIAHFYNLRHNS